MGDDLRDIERRLSEAGSSRIMKGIQTAAESYAIDTLDLTRRLMRVRLNARTGRLIGSLAYKVTRRGNRVIAETSSGGGREKVRYAAIHEYGGTVTGNPMLRIPLPPALTGRGVDRMAGVSIRNRDEFRLQPRLGKPPVIIHEPSGKPWYVLQRSVKIPPRPTIGPASRFKTRSLIRELEGLVDIIGRS